MTKEEIKTAIAKGIAGQGTNVDGGGYLPKILDAIVDAIPEGGGNEPLVVEGTVDVGEFTPNEGEAGLAEAITAFEQGRPVFIRFTLDDDDKTLLCVGKNIDVNESQKLIFNNVVWTE